MSAPQIQKLTWLVEVIADNQPITFKEISDRWLDCDFNYGGAEYKRRSFQEHKAEIFDIWGIDIKCNGYNEYYISEDESIPTSKWMINTFTLNNTLNGAKSLKDRIKLEDVPSSRKWLSQILQAMKEGCCLEITHQSFKKDVPTTRVMQPFFMQMHNRRWYLHAFDEKERKILTLSLDRILEVKTLTRKFVMPSDCYVNDYLSQGYGVSVFKEVKKQKIKLRTTSYAACFLRTLPIHDSQKEIEKTDEYSIFEFNLPPVDEFLYDILHRGESVEIISPESVRNKMREIVNNLGKLYEKKKN